MRGRADGYASTLVGKAANISNALQAWSTQNQSRTLSDTSWSDGTATDLVPTYLDILPPITPYAQGNGSTDKYFKAMPISNISFSSPNNEGTNFDCLFAVITDANLCKAIARLSGNATTTPIYRNIAGSTMGDFSSNMAGADFQCVVNDANNNSAIDSGETMFFIYKVF